MGVSCVYESCTNHRPQSSETKVSAFIGNRTPILSNQRGSELTHQRCRRPTRTGSSLAFQSHRAVPNLVHFPLIAPCRGNFLHFLAFLFLHLSGSGLLRVQHLYPTPHTRCFVKTPHDKCLLRAVSFSGLRKMRGILMTSFQRFSHMLSV